MQNRKEIFSLNLSDIFLLSLEDIGDCILIVLQWMQFSDGPVIIITQCLLFDFAMPPSISLGGSSYLQSTFKSISSVKCVNLRKVWHCKT